MVGTCENCPGEAGVDAFLQLILDEADCVDSTHRYKQWVSTDRCQLLEVVKDWDEFIYDLSVSVVKLTNHHYVAVHQSRAFKQCKENAAEGEAVVVGDFSENYTFVLQDEVQSYHWDAPQCTVHPFVAYWRENGEQQHQSYCVISDHLKHNTATVHAFQKALIPRLKEKINHSLKSGTSQTVHLRSTKTDSTS